MGNTCDEERSKELIEAHDDAWNHAFGYLPSMALRCALELGIPDIISNHDRPVTVSELVEQLSIPETKSLFVSRLMQLLAHTGIFAAQKDEGDDQEGYTLTSSSKLLLSNDRGITMAPFLLMALDPVIVTPCLSMADWLRGTDSTPFETVHGMGVFEYFKKDSDFSTRNNYANACNSQVETRGLLKDLIPKLEGYESLIDVGGGTGAVADIISEAVPHLKCTVFELPTVLACAKPMDNITFVAGNMYESIPTADIIFFKEVLTTFCDEDSLKALKRSREALQRGNNRGKVIIVDPVKDRRKSTPESIKRELCYQLVILTGGNGAQRTEMEWKKLFLEAGFTSYNITPSLSVNSIIEVFP